MNGSHSRSVPPRRLHLSENITASTIQDDDSGQTLINSSPVHRLSKKVPRRSLLQSTGALRRLSLLLHSMLLAIHVVLIIVWSRELEHRIIFSVGSQRIVSLFVSGLTTTFATVYSAVLVFVTQTLSLRRSLRIDQTLTTTHDHAAAWMGIGSAVVQLWQQKMVPAPIVDIVFLYLGSILVLHITTPALFSVETFDSTRRVDVRTNSLPAYDWSNLSPPNWPKSISEENAVDMYASGSMYFLPSVVAPNATSLGLHQGTLYDVLEPNPLGTGQPIVNATGFNITCGYLTDVILDNYVADQSGDGLGSTWIINASNIDNHTISIPETNAGIISVPGWSEAYNSMVLYSTIPIVDSGNNRGSSLNLTPPMNTSVSSVQFLRCFQTLVSQTAIVDSRSGQIIPGTVSPDIKKTTSAWSSSASRPGSGSRTFRGDEGADV
ncbi:hypothetical protein C8R44DRAFT_757970 [Mycena epipterygia]|nr:hypothetical protein C8R44DRAFT_757970 [Mycena epipterygia]